MTDLLTMSQVVTLPSVNLLPPEIAAARRLQRLKLGLGVGVVVVVTGVGLGYMALTGSVSAAQTDLASTQQAGATTQRTIATYASVPATFQAVSAAQEQLSQAMSPEVRWSYRLNELSLSTPANVWLTALNVTKAAPVAAQPGKVVDTSTAPVGAVAFQGAARTFDDIAVWLEKTSSIRDAKGRPVYGNVYLTTASETPIDNTPAVTFTATADVTPAAFSGRYTTKAVK